MCPPLYCGVPPGYQPLAAIEAIETCTQPTQNLRTGIYEWEGCAPLNPNGLSVVEPPVAPGGLTNAAAPPAAPAVKVLPPPAPGPAAPNPATLTPPGPNPQ
jgi:hypothetical protein